MTRVLVVSDIRFYREGLAELLQRDGRLEVVGTAANREEALALVRKAEPDFVLLDTALPEAHASVAWIASHALQLKVIAIAVNETESEILEWAEAGIAAYVTREESMDELIDRVEGASRGELRCSPRVAASLLERVSSLTPLQAERWTDPTPGSLTRREHEILELVERGLANKDIARRLFISVATVKSHVHSILEKLQVSRRAEAAAWLRRHPASLVRRP